jgi:hypothetical protein
MIEPLFCAHDRDHGLRHVEHAAQTDVEYGVVVGTGDVERLAWLGDAGVVEQESMRPQARRMAAAAASQEAFSVTPASTLRRAGSRRSSLRPGRYRCKAIFWSIPAVTASARKSKRSAGGYSIAPALPPGT